MPGAVRAVVVSGNDIEGEFALQFRDRLFLRSVAADEGVEGGERERHVGSDGVVFEVPVVRREQVQLEVLGTLVADVLADRSSRTAGDPIAEGRADARSPSRRARAAASGGARRPVV